MSAMVGLRAARGTIGVLGAVAIAGLGCSGGDAPAVCSPRSSTGQLNAEAVSGLVVAPDEKHVAFVRDVRRWESGCPARASDHVAGTLVALTLGSDTACERVVAHDVQIYSVAFSSTSGGMVFQDGVDDCGIGDLKTASADGSGVRLLQHAVSQQEVVGSTVFFSPAGVTDTYSDTLAAPIAPDEGKPVSIGPASDIGGITAQTNASGTAVAYYASSPSPPDSLAIVQLPSGETRIVVDGIDEHAGGRIWSTRGEWLAFSHTGPGVANGLALVKADGTGRTEVSTEYGSNVLGFAPDDSWLAYDEPDSSGGSRLLTHSLQSGRDVVLGVLPAGYAGVTFSSDGADVGVLVDPPASDSRLIYGATAGVAGSLKLLDSVAFSNRIAVGGGHVAAAVAGPYAVQVYPVSGGPAVTVAGGQDPQFEPGVPQPDLLVWQYPPLVVAVASSDGTAAAFQTITDPIGFASWLGSVAVYGTAAGAGTGPDDLLTTITALTNTGTSATQLVYRASAYGWAAAPTPTRLFYARSATTADGSAGLWTVDLPR
jgi:hypothetical protein